MSESLFFGVVNDVDGTRWTTIKQKRAHQVQRRYKGKNADSDYLFDC